MIKVEIGQQFVNQTWNYLFPCLLDHGDVFKNKVNSVFKFAVGIHDTLLDGSDIIQGNNIFMLIDAQYQRGYYKAFVDWIRTQPYYVEDYWLDTTMAGARRHMIIISVPEKHTKAYEHFLKSEYSLMYDRYDRKRLFYDREKLELYNIMERNMSARIAFAQKVKKEFGTEDISHTEIGECDFPLVKEDNIFNCFKGERVYFNEKLDKVWS